MRAFILLCCVCSLLVAVPPPPAPYVTLEQASHEGSESERRSAEEPSTETAALVRLAIALAIGLAGDAGEDGIGEDGVGEDGEPDDDDERRGFGTQVPPEDHHEVRHVPIGVALLFELIPPIAHGTDDECPDGWGRKLIRPPNHA